jgi:hypothetical protein
MALEQEPMADTLARADSTVRFTATGGEENGPYQWDRFSLVRGADRWPGTGMGVLGTTITVRFPVPLRDGDQVELPGA